MHIPLPPPSQAVSGLGTLMWPQGAWHQPRGDLLTQQGRGAITQGVLLVSGHAEGWHSVEGLGQEGLQAGGTGIGGMEEVVDLLTGRTQLGHCSTEWGQGCPRGLGGTRSKTPRRGKAGHSKRKG